MRRFRFLAWITLAATLYGAASPLLAALFLANTPAALGEMLGIPAPAAMSMAAEDCASHPEHDTAPAQNGPGAPQSGHERHGIHCSLCLNPNSVATIALAPVAFSFLSLAFDVVQPAPAGRRFASFLPLYRSRAPPAAS
jgi:hypothetical protein